MKKGIVTVFIILGILVLGLIIWFFVFNGGGLQTAFNAIANPINNVYHGMTGNSSADLINTSGSFSSANNLNSASQWK